MTDEEMAAEWHHETSGVWAGRMHAAGVRLTTMPPYGKAEHLAIWLGRRGDKGEGRIQVAMRPMVLIRAWYQDPDATVRVLVKWARFRKALAGEKHS